MINDSNDVVARAGRTQFKHGEKIDLLLDTSEKYDLSIKHMVKKADYIIEKTQRE